MPLFLALLACVGNQRQSTEHQCHRDQFRMSNNAGSHLNCYFLQCVHIMSSLSSYVRFGFSQVIFVIESVFCLVLCRVVDSGGDTDDHKNGSDLHCQSRISDQLGDDLNSNFSSETSEHIIFLLEFKLS